MGWGTNWGECGIFCNCGRCYGSLELVLWSSRLLFVVIHVIGGQMLNGCGMCPNQCCQNSYLLMHYDVSFWKDSGNTQILPDYVTSSCSGNCWLMRPVRVMGMAAIIE